jgi:hypothetical protein
MKSIDAASQGNQHLVAFKSTRNDIYPAIE